MVGAKSRLAEDLLSISVHASQEPVIREGYRWGKTVSLYSCAEITSHELASSKIIYAVTPSGQDAENPHGEIRTHEPICRHI